MCFFYDQDGAFSVNAGFLLESSETDFSATTPASCAVALQLSEVSCLSDAHLSLLHSSHPSISENAFRAGIV